MTKQILKAYIKSFIAYSLYYTGIIFVIKRWRLKRKAVVLTYHRILPYSERNSSFSHSAIIVDPIKFGQQMTFIKRCFNVVNIDEFSSHIINKQPFRDSTCLVTFDDGWLDNYQYAFPILNSNDIPGLIFTPTDYIGKDKLFWQEAMGHGFYQLLSLDTKDSKKIIDEHNLAFLREKETEQAIGYIMDYVRSLKKLSYFNIL